MKGNMLIAHGGGPTAKERGEGNLEAVKGKNVKLRKEIAVASMENLRHEGIFGALVSHGSSTVPQYIVEEINNLGGEITNADGIPMKELKAAIPCGISKINVDTDIRLAVTRNLREYFYYHPEKRKSPSISGIYQLLEEKRSQRSSWYLNCTIWFCRLCFLSRECKLRTNDRTLQIMINTLLIVLT